MKADADLKHSVRREMKALVPRWAYVDTAGHGRDEPPRGDPARDWLCWECGAVVPADGWCQRCTP